MKPPKVSDEDYINFLIATPRVCSGVEASRLTPPRRLPMTPLRACCTGLSLMPRPSGAPARCQVDLHQGILVIDDSTLDQPYAKKIDMVGRHWSGKHHAVVEGINLITLL